MVKTIEFNMVISRRLGFQKLYFNPYILSICMNILDQKELLLMHTFTKKIHSKFVVPKTLNLYYYHIVAIISRRHEAELYYEFSSQTKYD